MAITDLGIITRSISGRPFLSVTTILTVGVAVALMLVLLSTKDAGFRAFDRGPGNIHLVVSRDDSPLVSVLNAVFYAGSPRRPIGWDEYESLTERLPLEFAIPIQQGDSHRGFPVVATTREFFTLFNPDPEGPGWQLADGRVFEATWEVVVGAKAARDTGLRVGDRLYLSHGHSSHDTPTPTPPPADHDHHHGHDHDHHDHDHGHDHDHHDHDHDHGHHHHDHEGHEGHVHTEFVFTVVGVLEPTGGPHDRALFTPLEGSWIVHAHDRRLADDPTATLTRASDITPEDRLITGIYLRVASREGSVLSGGLQQVFDTLRRNTSVTVAQPGEQIRRLFQIVSSIDQLFVALVGVVMLSSAITIMLALYAATEQRRRQIAILRVLGFSRARIFSLVLTESALIGVLGAALGFALSVVGSQAVAAAMRARLGLNIEPEPISSVSLIVITATVLMAAAAGIIPAIRAYRISVIKSLQPVA